MYYIYAYIDPRDNLPFYIGKGKDSRKFDHLKERSSKKENKEKWQIIKELLDVKTPPIILELENNIEDECMAFNREDYYILKYGRRGIDTNGILTNKTIGGKQPPTPIWNLEKKQQHSNFNKSYWTEEKRKEHGLLTKGNKAGGIGHTQGTVSVTDLGGNTKRIPKSSYDAIDKTTPINTWEYVAVSSKESKRRIALKNTP